MEHGDWDLRRKEGKRHLFDRHDLGGGEQMSFYNEVVTGKKEDVVGKKGEITQQR